MKPLELRCHSFWYNWKKVSSKQKISKNDTGDFHPSSAPESSKLSSVFTPMVLDGRVTRVNSNYQPFLQ
jgi:hypothetical protein